jgi:two-component system, cell cycle sensor histidine kinase and response regulator CckA
MNKTTVLIAEDEAIIAEDLAEKLRRLGYEVSGKTARGEEAIAFTRDQRPDVVLMDIHLRGRMDGVEAADRIRRECAVPVVFLTALSDRATLQRAKLSEPFGYILKPFEERDLETHIEMALYRHRAEQEVRQLNAVLEQRVTERTAEVTAAARYARSLIETSLDPLITISLDGKIIDVNRATELVTGELRAELVGSDFSHYFTEPSRADASYQQALAQGAVRDYPLTIRHTSGRTTDVLYNAAVYRNEAGEVQGVFAAARDMTERKAAEMERQTLRDELARVSRITTGGQLAASLAHELNQPLGAIVCNVQAIEQLLAQTPPDFSQLRETLRDIEAAGKRAGAVIHQLRRLYQKTGRDRGPLQLNDILQKTVGLLHSEFLLKTVALRLELDPLLPAVWGNEVELQQVVLNLITNALEAMTAREPWARQLDIRTLSVEPNTIRASIRDCGTGLTEEQMRHIFEPFYTTKVNGMGMGLTICQSILETHGGRLWAENNPDRGTSFHLSLPAFCGQSTKKNNPLIT